MQKIKSITALSWRKISLFFQCKRCFYKEQVLQKKVPQMDPDCFSLNNAVDQLMKNEFDQYREQQKPHPIMIENNINAVPYKDKAIIQWRDYQAGGINFIDRINGFYLCGIIDDVWINAKEELIIVDYKTTAQRQFNSMNAWVLNNMRQLAFYANILKKNGYKISNKGYFIYCLVNKNKELFSKKLEFDTIVKPYSIDDIWVDETLQDIRKFLNLPIIPQPAYNCNFCKFDLGNIN